MGKRPASASTPTALADDLVGREGERAQVLAALDAASAGRGGVLFLAGEAGIGKSRLAAAVASDASARRVPVLRGRATQAGARTPYRPLAEALCGAVRAGLGPDPIDLGPFRTMLSTLVPEWRQGDGPPMEESYLGVAEGVLRFLRATGGSGPTLVVVDDFHWADLETVTVLEYLADNLAAEPVLCLVTVRDEERTAGAELARLLRARRVAAVVQMTPLSADLVVAMVASCLGTPDLPEEVLAFAGRAEGVPFMIEELLAAAIATGALEHAAGSWSVVKPLNALVPTSFGEIIRARVRGLGEEGPRVLGAAAVLGRRFDWSLIPAMTRLPDQEVLRVLHEASDALVVTGDAHDGTFRFRHALSRDAVLGTLFAPERQALALTALEALDARSSEEDPELAVELATAAGDEQRAARVLIAGGRRALRAGALATAEATLERVRSLVGERDPAQAEVDELLLEVLSLAGKRSRAAEVGAALLGRIGGAPQESGRRAEVHLRLARASIEATRWEDADHHLDRAYAEAPAVPGELAPRISVARAQAVIGRDPARSGTLAQEALAAAERLGLPEVACQALEVLGRLRRPRDLTAAEEAFGRALVIAEQEGLTVWRSRALHELGAIDMLKGRSVDRLLEARELALASGALATAAVVDVQVAAALVVSDDPDAGADAARRSAELSRRYRFDQTLAAAMALEAYAHARRRRPDEMQRCIREARRLEPGAPDVEVKVCSASALYALVEEDRTTARRHLCAGLAAAATSGDYSAVPAIGLLALLRAVDGADDESPELQVPPSSVHFLAEAFLRYATAVVAGKGGDSATATILLAAGDSLLGDHAWFRHLGHRLVAEAAMADGWGEPAELLRGALDYFGATGDDRIGSACRSLLRRAGVAVPHRRDDTGVPDELRVRGVTAREHEVLRLLALGLPNKEIGARLYLSPRTVERHVANLCIKIGVERRAQLVAYAARTTGPAADTTADNPH